MTVIDRIYEALDRDDPERAFELAAEALSEGDDPVLRFLGGVALSEIGRTRAALDEFRRSVELDPDDHEYRSQLALAMFRDCRFDESEAEVRRILEDDADFSDALVLRAMLLERRGRFEDADRDLMRAHEIDPERFPPPIRLPRSEFEAEIERAADELPARFRKPLDEVTTFVEDVPSEEILTESDPPLDPELLGLFVGVALPDQTHFSVGGDIPPRILLFQRNLERMVSTPEELRREIAITLFHELGHYLGLDEDELAEIDLA
ncbi:MAG: metallopeptidase family protein [Acidobacteriota bacterium]|nr:metallopeptidase family protein [Acidobacteriota bacterium]